jgi:hypothetical protein
MDSKSIIGPDMNKMPTWSGANGVISSSTCQMSEIGYIPVVSHPITKHDNFHHLEKFEWYG